MPHSTGNIITTKMTCASAPVQGAKLWLTSFPLTNLPEDPERPGTVKSVTNKDGEATWDLLVNAFAERRLPRHTSENRLLG